MRILNIADSRQWRWAVACAAGALFAQAGVAVCGNAGGGTCSCELDNGTIKTVNCNGAECGPGQIASCCEIVSKSGTVAGCGCECVE